MKIPALVLLSVFVWQSGCARKPAVTESAPPPDKQPGVSIEALAGASKAAPEAVEQANPATQPETAPAAPAQPEAPSAPSTGPGESLDGESELTNWSFTLEYFVHKNKRFPKDINELATSVGKPVPRAPAGYRITFDQENKRVVLVKAK
jgi:hypothetical protein